MSIYLRHKRVEFVGLHVSAEFCIGTLYRHFPTRDALIEAVYRNEAEHLTLAATRLSAKHPPITALREWLLVFVRLFGHEIQDGGGAEFARQRHAALYAESGAQMKRAIAKLTDGAVTSGDIRLDMEPLDLLRALAGIMNRDPGPDSKQAARHLVDILIAGISTRKG